MTPLRLSFNTGLLVFGSRCSKVRAMLPAHVPPSEIALTLCNDLPDE